MRLILTVLVLASTTLTAACGTVKPIGSNGDDAAEQPSGGIVWGEAGSSSTDTTAATADSGDTTDSGDDSDSGTTDSGDTDSGTTDTTDDCKVSAKVGIIPKTEWDPGVANPTTANPEFHLWYVGNDTTGDYDGWGEASGSETSSNAYIAVNVEYCPGDTLVVGGDYFDGYRNRWLAEASGVVNILPDEDADDAKRVIIDFGDGNWQGYQVGGDTPNMGEAGWVDNGDGGGDVFIATFDDTDTHDDRL